MSTRRQTRPDYFWRIWMAIKNVNQQKLLSDVTHILENMPVHLNMHITHEQLSEHLETSVDEKLLLAEDVTIDKGPKKGQKNRTYKIPDFDLNLDIEEHDWYCYHCHLGKEVNFCSTCPRVFHSTCHSSSKNKSNTNGTNDLSENTHTNGGDEAFPVIEAPSTTETTHNNHEDLNKTRDENSETEIKNRIEFVSQTDLASPTIPEILKNERESFDADSKVTFMIFFF